MRAFKNSVSIGQTVWKLPKKKKKMEMESFMTQRTHFSLVIDLLPHIPIHISFSSHITLMYIVTFQIRNYLGHVKTLSHFKFFVGQNETLHAYIHTYIHPVHIYMTYTHRIYIHTYIHTCSLVRHFSSAI